ncbi:MAG: TetR/AcrR family transcriptional regulator [Candidatus Aminicenantes bacterium]|nr:MAG: TetR/AcrR family transcriptional regulator [Candidatus Aminicenantes bacterium]
MMAIKKPKQVRTGEIIRAAVDEFLENGYEKTSMESIARRAGVSKGGLYHHFSSKDEILLLANKKLNEPIYTIMQQASQHLSASEGLNSYIKHYLEYWMDHKREMVFYTLSYVKLLDNPSLWEMYEKYTENTIAFFQDLFQRGIDSGEFYPHSAYDSAIAFMAAVDGIVMYLMMDSNLELEKIVSILQERFVHGLKANRDKPYRSEEK